MQKQSKRLALVAMMIVVGVMSAMLLIGSAAAAEKDPYSNNGPRVLPSVLERGEPTRPDAVINERERRPDDSSERGPLPFTGADLTLFLATGMAAVATGSVIVRRTRSRTIE